MPDPEPETSAFAEPEEDSSTPNEPTANKQEEMHQVFASEEEQNQAMI
jgi:hypothetical protein